MPEKHRTALLAVAFNLALFLATYFPAAVWARYRDTYNVVFAWEASIPVIEWMIIPYVSLFVLFAAPWIVLPAAEIRRLSRAVMFSTLAGAFFFFLVPTHNGNDFPQVTGFFAPFFNMVYFLDLPYNMVPSLHVAWAFLFHQITRPFLASRWLRAAWSGWIVLVVASTVFTHQHHIVDVLGGLLLGAAIMRLPMVRYWSRYPLSMPAL